MTEPIIDQKRMHIDELNVDKKLSIGGTQVTATAAQINLLTQGVAAGYKIARGVATITADSQDVVTGLTTVVSVNATLAGDPVATHSQCSASIGDQNGAPAAGSIRIKSWKPTSTSNPILVAATTPWVTVNWVAIGT